MDKTARLALANSLLLVIAHCGRSFFRYGDRVGRFEFDARGRLWFVDAFRGRRIYTHERRHPWTGFSEGGTLRGLVIGLSDWICHGTRLHHLTFGPWPEWVCGGDLWAYGPDMQKVRDAAAAMDCLASVGPRVGADQAG